ncbi:hypothetical protein [Pseudoduganella violacea]|uniref:Uncharacterized protein n=1 Tax=Pseudoduganella violacea TaxID=1715466 RepID=A0A7W5B728_9BURK|nr:hypothetical protein [Pseudoduganella violacea]MBB3117370.1 hypothetical protein [Pseudoduganella violacea]
MDQSSTAYEAAPAFRSSAQRPGGMLAGIVVSLLVHALLILMYRGSTPPLKVLPPDEARRTTTVWLLRPAPPKPAAAPVAPEAPPPVAQTKSGPAAKPVTRRQELAIRPRTEKRAAQPIREKPADEAIVAAPALPADPFAQPASNGKFDLDAARKSARQLASEPELPDDAPLSRLKAQQRQRDIQEGKLAREMTKAARPDCKDGLPGGLLAPLFLLMDKKDHGCKW